MLFYLQSKNNIHLLELYLQFHLGFQDENTMNRNKSVAMLLGHIYNHQVMVLMMVVYLLLLVLPKKKFHKEP